MAKRPVFIEKDTFPFYEIKEIEFKYYSGFAVSQKQKSIRELHCSFRKESNERVLEISTKSFDGLGVTLSAFNLTMKVDDKEYCIECVFQGSKRFEKGGPFTDLYTTNPWEAKRDPRLRGNGNIVDFQLQAEHFENEPQDFFYNWIYIRALYQHEDYLKNLKGYGAFTDIEFNPKKSINCQAKAIAIAVGLMKANLIDACMEDKQTFLEIVYRQHKYGTYEQMSIFEIHGK